MAFTIGGESRTTLRRCVTWAGLRAGDVVAINAPKERRHRYEFVAFVQNPVTGDEWVEVRGGRQGEQKDRSFRPDLVFPASARQGSRITGSSLFDAPQLPWR